MQPYKSVNFNRVLDEFRGLKRPSSEAGEDIRCNRDKAGHVSGNGSPLYRRDRRDSPGGCLV